MDGKKAGMDILANIHAAIAQQMLAKLQETEPVMVMSLEGPVPTGQVRYTATNADWKAITGFLKDNSCVADMNTNKGLGNLDRELKARKKRSDNVTELPLPNLAAVNGN